MKSSNYTAPDAAPAPAPWADALMNKAESDGINVVLEVKYTVIDILKAKHGEPTPDWGSYRLRNRASVTVPMHRISSVRHLPID